MIDYLSTLSKKLIWLKPLFLLTTIGAFIVFGYVMLFVNGTKRDIYLIPCIISFLWSLTCWLILSFIPYVPDIANRQQRFVARITTAIVRGGYYLLSLVFVLLSLFIFALTFKLVNVWRVQFFI